MISQSQYHDSLSVADTREPCHSQDYPSHTQESMETFDPIGHKMRVLELEQQTIEEEFTDIDENLFMRNSEHSLRGNAYVLSQRLPSLVDVSNEDKAVKMVKNHWHRNGSLQGLTVVMAPASFEKISDG